jgi:hypothetical protein
MSIVVAAARPILRYRRVIANLLDGPDLVKTISLIAISIVLLSFNVLSLSSIFNAYAQTQSGPATSGSATSGPNTFNCTAANACSFGGPTSGPATSGPATSGPATSGPANSGAAIVTAVNGTGTLNCINQNHNYANITFNNTHWKVIASPKYSLYGLITNVSFDNDNFIMQGSEPHDNCGINENSPESKAVTIISSCGNNAPIAFKVSDPAMGSIYHRTYVDQNGTFVGNVICSTTATPLSTMSPTSNSTS